MKLSRNAVAASLAISAAMASVSCVNEDYDLRKPIDLTVNVDGEISLPLIKNSEFITIGELLKDAELGENIVLVPFGDEGKKYYMLSIQGDPENPISGNFGKLDFDIAGSFKDFVPQPLRVLKDLGGTLSIDLSAAIGNTGNLPPGIDIEDILNEAGLSSRINIVGNTPKKIKSLISEVVAVLDNYGIDFNPDEIGYPPVIEIPVAATGKDALPIDMTAELPALVGDIGEIEIGADITFRLGPNFGKVVLGKGFRISLPERLHLEKVSQDNAWSLDGSAIVFNEDFHVYGGTEFMLRIKGIDGAGSVKPGLDGNSLSISEEISIEGNAICDVKELLEDQKIENQEILDPIEFKVEIELGEDVKVGNVQVLLDLESGLGEAGIEDQEIELGKILPEAISKEDITLDIDNPVIILSVSNGSPLEASLKAEINAYDAGGKSVLDQAIDLGGKNVNIRASTDQEHPQVIAISRKGLSEELKQELNISSENDIRIPELGTLIQKLPNKITIENIGIEPVGDNEFMNINLEDYAGRELNFSCNYEVRAPLAFGEDLEIRYGLEPIKGLNKNFSSVTESEENGMKINLNDLHLNLSVLNSLPLALGLEVTPIDLEGNPIKSDDLKVEINFSNAENTQEILSGKRNGTDTETQKTDISILIAPKSIEVLEQFDGVEIFLVGNDGQAAGVALNDHHGVQITDVTVRILGGVEINGGNIELIK